MNNNSGGRWIVHGLRPLKVVRLGRSETVAPEAVVNYREWATMKLLWEGQFARRVIATDK